MDKPVFRGGTYSSTIVIYLRRADHEATNAGRFHCDRATRRDDLGPAGLNALTLCADRAHRTLVAMLHFLLNDCLIYSFRRFRIAFSTANSGRYLSG